jgi:ABC-2 type transport system permease protein
VLLLQTPAVRAAFVRWFEQQGFAFTQAFSGPTLAQHLVGFAVGGPGAVFIALVAAHAIAGERDDGTLRLVLCRPVTRERVVGVKVLACIAYVAVVVLAASIGALGLGLAFEGRGPLLVHVPATGGRWLYAEGDGLLLYAWGSGFHALGLVTVAVTALALGCLGMRAPSAAAATVAYLLAEESLRRMPFLERVAPWLLTTHMTAWSRVFDAQPGWGWVADVYGPLALYDAVVLALAAVAFHYRDVAP